MILPLFYICTKEQLPLFTDLTFLPIASHPFFFLFLLCSFLAQLLSCGLTSAGTSIAPPTSPGGRRPRRSSKPSSWPTRKVSARPPTNDLTPLRNRQLKKNCCNNNNTGSGEREKEKPRGMETERRPNGRIFDLLHNLCVYRVTTHYNCSWLLRAFVNFLFAVCYSAENSRCVHRPFAGGIRSRNKQTLLFFVQLVQKKMLCMERRQL